MILAYLHAIKISVFFFDSENMVTLGFGPDFSIRLSRVIRVRITVSVTARARF